MIGETRDVDSRTAARNWVFPGAAPLAGAEEDRERGLALGANAYISKPIQSSHLIKTISELLSV
jgi:hypothetical protein